MAGVDGCLMRVCADSRGVRKGDIFVATPGTKTDGHDYIRQAVANGAKYVVCQRDVSCDGAEMIIVQNSAQALGLLAHAVAGNPCGRLTNLAVTGTNGKTTVSFLVRSVVKTAGYKCGMLGTVIYDTGKLVQEAPLTTPDALTIADAARAMADNGDKFLVLEASSHALAQDRLYGIAFTAAAFTNLTGDHLDYHGTMEAYLDAKSRLFTELPPHAIAVLNAESDAARRIAEKLHVRILWYAIERPADIVARIESMDARGSVFRIEFNNYMEKVRTALPGRHNISNHLAAAGLCLAAGFDLGTVAKGLSALESVPGRLEPVNTPAAMKAGVRVFVDYAHTDDALQNVLSTLRPICAGRLILVFGCGGDRDKTKRPRMAQAAQERADVIIVTSDNPRTEEPLAIIDQVKAGFSPQALKEKVRIEPDRKKAIALAVSVAKKDDVILIAGKGHETCQILGTTKIHFSDQETAREMLELIV